MRTSLAGSPAVQLHPNVWHGPNRAVAPCLAHPHQGLSLCHRIQPSLKQHCNHSLFLHSQQPCLASVSPKCSPRRPTAAAQAAATASPGSTPEEQQPNLFMAAMQQYQRFTGLAGKFMPMVGLFFLLAFVNTILDSLKDTLVITAVGGGAQVIPYLTVYAVLPSSVAFLVAYSYASQHMSRAALFNAIVAVFMGFFALFAFVMYPNHAALHPHAFSDSLAKVLPCGVEGLVGMIRNWTFTAFFCMSELWGDVCLGLLFWGLANDTTQLSDAPTLYPLFGLGANVAQALGGTVLKAFSSVEGKPTVAGVADFSSEIQSLMMVVMAVTCAALALHSYINKQHDAARAARVARRTQRAAVQAESAAAAAAQSVSSSSVDQADQTADKQQQQQGEVEGDGKKKSKPSVKEIFGVLAASIPIRCLAIMSLAQGLCTSLMEFAWKSHIGLLFPSPPQFTAFLGDVSMWQGLVTGVLMVLSPAMFSRMGWAGVAGATPLILLSGGAVFFTACLVYQFAFASHAASALAHAATNTGSPAAWLMGGLDGAVLQLLVYGGALLYVFSKSAKFSLFKPAEEMVYISLDEEGRTKGKAAIDVVGSQAGKSGGSVLQQALLLISGGAIAGILPVMAICYFAMAQGWLKSVATLSQQARYGQPETQHVSVAEMHERNFSSDEEIDVDSHQVASTQLPEGGSDIHITSPNGHSVHMHVESNGSSRGNEPARVMASVSTSGASHVGQMNGTHVTGYVRVADGSAFTPGNATSALSEQLR